MRRAVLLLHSRTDGSSHGDWLLERSAGTDPDERALIAFRTGSRIDNARCCPFECERIQDHRRRYLDFEGALTEGRGDVRRLAAGRVLSLEFEAESLIADIQWGDCTIRYSGALAENGVWRFNAVLVGGR